MAHALSFVNVFASNLMKNDSSYTRSEAMKVAYQNQKAGKSKLLVFRKKTTGEIARRIVREDWWNFQAPKGGQSNRKEGQRLFADMFKAAYGAQNCIISAYDESIIFYA